MSELRPGELIWTTQQVAHELGISDRHVRRLADEGVFKVAGTYKGHTHGRPVKLFRTNQVLDAWRSRHKNWKEDARQ